MEVRSKETSAGKQGRKVVLKDRRVEVAIFNADSETTIYKNVVELEYEKNQQDFSRNFGIRGSQMRPKVVNEVDNIDNNSQRVTSSSEDMEGISSDENLTSPEQDRPSLQIEIDNLKQNNNDLSIQNFIDYRLQDQRQQLKRGEQCSRNYHVQRKGPEPKPNQRGGDRERCSDQNPLDKPRRLLRKAEEVKDRMFQVPGKDIILHNLPHSQQIFNESELFHSVLVDESYALVESHVDEVTRKKIISLEYVDLAKLIPKDRVMQSSQEQRMEMVNRNGMTYWVPFSENTASVINSYNKWQQAFRVYTTIFVEEHPGKAKELMQYNHIIFSASVNFVWENMYSYDIDFRLHLSKHPGRNWGIILHQAWTMRMKDRLKFTGNSGNHAFSESSSTGGRPYSRNNSGKRKKICWKYNAGQCTYGFSCKFEHKCGICGKFRHGAHICRKAKSPQNDDKRRNYSHHHHRKQGNSNNGNNSNNNSNNRS